ncbi:hypothetical protein V2O64_20715 [Verrucomicrobiaceae bacterium 227]
MRALLPNFESGNTKITTKRETWPCPVPVLSLDHIFVKKGLSIQAYQPLKKWSTDHSPMAVQIE